jgi:hypothetical protein
MYLEMSGRHSARSETIQIIRTSRLENSEVKRATQQQMLQKGLAYPKVRVVKRAPTKDLTTLFKADRPTLF